MATRGVDTDLLERAEGFAGDISDVLSAFTGEEQGFLATRLEDRVEVAAASSKNPLVLLRADGEVILGLLVKFSCRWDSASAHLSISTSQFVVYPGRDMRVPLFRVDYVHDQNSKLPAAHLQVHAHRDAFTHLLSIGGKSSRRAKARRKRGAGDPPPAVAEFHFPMGGPRYRLSLEDLLDTLMEEFGLDSGPEWASLRDRTRVEWRKSQLRAAVRDSPETAAGALRDLGYEVSGEALPDRTDKLRRL